ncbi:Global transcription regulator sge1 [Emydomyces testavorans]|uniref:Global transcription regulator sge1 n=1 Tax=Emydomyces testavorans TaxID=2070801 RepID=A0AAF0ILF1_9EURO|nr:Global transcription regulator sge1 [Emydomyces testavorans]
MGNGTAAVLEPTYTGYVASTHDALILFEACLTGVLHHVPRRPHDRERAQLVRSGSVFIYEENASGIKRWTDGVTWSPSRILGNFLVYRELDKPFPPGEKKRAMKKGSRRPAQPTRAGEPYPRPQTESNGQPYSPATSSGTPYGERSAQSELERALVGSLVDSYGFKDSGLVKKTMSVTVSGVTHHLVSYYSVEDVMRGVLNPPSMVESLKYIRPRPELTTKQSFRAPIDDLEPTNMEEADPNQALYGYRPPMVGQGYPMPNPNYYPIPGAGYVPHPQQPGPIPGYAPIQGHPPYIQNPAASSEMPPKTEDYSTFRGPAGYATGYEPANQPMPHMPSTMNRPHHAPNPSLYRTPSLPGRNVQPDIPQSVDPNAQQNPASYQRSSFSVQSGVEGNQPLDQRNMPQSTFDASAPRRDSGNAYYNGGDSQQQQQQQQPPLPPPQQPQQHQRQPSVPQQSPQQQPQQSPYYAAGGQQAYQSAQPHISSWPTSGSRPAQV